MMQGKKKNRTKTNKKQKQKTKTKTNKQKNHNTLHMKTTLFGKIGLYTFKGVLHPRSVFGLFLHFSQKLQHIGNK